MRPLLRVNRTAALRKLLLSCAIWFLVFNAVCATASDAIPLIPPGSVWKYNDESVDLGSAWVAPGYDDNSWSNGLAVLGFRSLNVSNYGTLPAPNRIRTLLRKVTPTNSSLNIMTFYFRKHFALTGDLAGMTLIASNLIDDGAIFYLNGQELTRLAMPTGPVTWGTRATRNELISSASHSYEIFALPATALVEGDNVVAVEVHQGTPTSTSMAFQMELWQQSGEPPAFGAQPVGASLFPGTNLTMSVALASGLDAHLQWFHNSDPLPDATNALLALTNMQFVQAGRYYVVASNSFGVATSSIANINIVGGVSKLRLLEFTNAWRFDQSGSDLGNAWSAVDYDDSSWPTGQGVFFHPANGFPEPANQVLSLTNDSGGWIITYYFRTHLALPAGVSNVVLLASNLLDDGAVFYLNGSEVGRIRMNGVVNATTLADYSPTQGLLYETILLTPTNTVLGDNVLAAEVHQYSPQSADVVFGMNLDAYGAFDQSPVILSAPVSQSVDEETSASFFADVLGAQPLSVQWFHNDVPIAGATNVAFRIDVAHPANEGNYTFVVSNVLNVVTSTVATLNVIPDMIPPTLIAGYGTNGITDLVVLFSDPVAPASATNIANYALAPSVNIVNARMLAPNAVLLTTAGLDPQFDYALTVTNVSDLADEANFIPPNSSTQVRPNRSLIATGLSRVQTVFIILMENQTWRNIKGNTNCPYINSLLPQASYCENYTSPSHIHPSEPNYIWLEAGDAFGHLDDDGPSIDRVASTNHLATQLSNAGIQWRGYMEDLPYGRTGTNSGGFYLARHNPFAFFDDVTMNYDYCTNHVRPYGEFAGDLVTGRIGRYNFITPNSTNDMHDSVNGWDRVTVGDNWLARELPQILSSGAFSNNGAVFITFDENDYSQDFPIPMIVLSPLAKGGGYASHVPYDHSSMLRTMQEIFRVRPLLGAAANAVPLNDLFRSLTLRPFQTNGSVAIRIDDPLPGRTNYLQASGDLLNWTSINTNVATNTITVFDPRSAGAEKRFYRVVEQP